MATTIGEINPYRYRGYRYDAEMGLYYLKSRYYDPGMGRFLNADAVVSGVGNVQGYNLFQYSMNNPVNMSDPSGHWPQWIKDTVNWVKNTFNIKTSTASSSEKSSRASGAVTGPTASATGDLGPFSNRSYASIGYAEGMFRGQLYKQFTPEQKADNTLVGTYGKASLIDYSIQNRIGNDNVGVSKKHVIDIGVVTAKTGIQYKQGPGVSLGGRVSAISSRETYCFDAFGWQVELGMDVYVLSA